MKFWNWGPTTIWVQIKKSLHPNVQQADPLIVYVKQADPLIVSVQQADPLIVYVQQADPVIVSVQYSRLTH